MSLLFVLLFFILGTIIGSFLNVLVVRGHDGVSLGGRSMCVHCYKQIPVVYLIPILGYLLSGRKCFSCSKSISIRYVIGEAVLGVLFALIAFFLVIPVFVPTIQFIFITLGTLIFVSTLFYISYYDILYQEIPTVSLIVLLVLIILQHITHSFHLEVFFGLLAGLPFFIIWLISRGKLIGLGDIFIMALTGLHLGLFLGGSAIILAFWAGSIFGILFILYQKLVYKKDYAVIRTIPIPFGPFLISAWLFTYVFQFNILSLFLL